MATLLKILCIIKHGNEHASNKAFEVVNFLQSQQIEVCSFASNVPRSEIVECAKTCHTGIVFGGDGTMLSIARALHDYPLPLIGINFGKVGFLTEIDPNNWEEALQNLVDYLKHKHLDMQDKSPKFFQENHSIFECQVYRKNALIHTCYAVNDAVIARGNIVRTISLSISINEDHLSSLRCDGLIVSTPLGATAYAISAHGPLALPGLDAQIITPICPFAGAFPPIVVAGSSKLCVEIMESSSSAILTMDGQENFELETNDLVYITEHSKKMALLVSDTSWYVKRLVDRGYIRQGPGSHSINEIKQMDK